MLDHAMELECSSDEPRVNVCAICKERAAKYKCPRCNVCTCSVACVREHKTQTSCDGVRNKTAYVSLSDFNNFTLLSDYRFLEEVGRKADNVRRYPLCRRGMSQRATHLLRAARNHGTNLRVLPYNFTRRRKNSSIFNFAKREIRWHIDWLFPHSHTTYTSKQTPEKTSPHECMVAMLENCGVDHSQALSVYTDVGVDQWNYLLKSTQATNRYEELKGDKSMQENLQGKSLVEYPVIYVVLDAHLQEYTLHTDAELPCSDVKGDETDATTTVAEAMDE